MKRLLDYCSVSGKNVPPFDGIKKYVATGDVINNRITSYENVDYKNKPSRANQIADSNEVLFAKMKDTKKVLLINEKTAKNIYSTGFFVIKANLNVLPEYLYWLFNSKKFNQDKDKNSKGATQKAINLEGLGKIMIKEIPSLDKQKEIINKINSCNEIIELKKEQLDELEKLIKSQFVEMFGDPEKNEKNWGVGLIRDLISDIKYGTSRPAVENGRYKYLRMNNITYEGKLDLTDIKYIDVPENEIEKCVAKRGDILFNRTNSRDLVGKTCVYNNDESMIIAGFVIRARVNKKANPYFISEYMNTKYMKNKLKSMCKNACGQSNINSNEFQNIRIYIPPIELQNQFAYFVEHIDKLEFELKKSLEETQNLFDSLMAEYFE